MPNNRSTRRPAQAARSATTDPPAVAPRRVVIERVVPEVNAGRFAAKRVVGDVVTVEVDVFTEGHDRIGGVLRYRGPGDDTWQEIALAPLTNDRWEAAFTVDRLGTWEYTIVAWIDDFASWRHGFERKAAVDHPVASELLEGAALVRDAALRARAADRKELNARADDLAADRPQADRVPVALADDLAQLMARYPDRSQATEYGRVLPLVVERERARYGAWYELFPRSCSEEPGRHATFDDCRQRLEYVAGMGFDVLYLPPVHPIGRSSRKGKNNQPQALPDDVGSPWGIGAAEGGHTAIHPDLGTLADFDRLVAEARTHGLEIALDIAFQTTPDHPWVTEHPQWFRRRPDGSIQYAENPPKEYRDIYPLNFDNPDWQNLWAALRDVVLFWIGHGVTIFRVDNPHTKPFAFWEWLIASVRAQHPETIFLSEAFTRPKVMRYLAKSGFSQSYTYFTWRNTRAELEEYFTELTQSSVARVHAAEPVHQHARHPARVSPDRQAPGVPDPPRPGGDPRRQLRDVWPGL